MWLIFVTIFIFFLYASLIAYYRNGWTSMPAFIVEKKPPNSYFTKVSVIIPARNETLNIANCIHSVLAQTYPLSLIEIIVVDDHSTDDTAHIVQVLSLVHSNIRLIKLQQPVTNMAYKKRAIQEGIIKATGSLIVTTDADCTHQKCWLEALIQCHEKYQAQFIAAPVSYITKKNILSIFQSLDFITMQGITGASVYKQFHTMCNGANLAYTKKAFETVNGFSGIDNVPTGDDMLLMHKIYRLDPSKVIYLKSKEAIVSTYPAYSWKDFFQQRIRWASKASHYDDKRIFWALLLVYFFNVWFLILLIGSFWKWEYLLAIPALIIIKAAVEIWFLIPVISFFNQRKWLIWFPFLQPLHIIYVIISGWLGKFGKYQWKGRTIASKPKNNVL